MKSLKFLYSPEVNPFFNISTESFLVDNCPKDQVTMYLWVNDNTVVIGKHQNAYKECNITLLESEGGTLLRRLTGGGAVYHDLANLNFTFIAHKDNYDLAKQMSVILTACKKVGINAELTGRNDITVEGKKFSGNAFLTRGDTKLHHGTILIDTSSEKMQRYLNVSKLKMQSKGVESVKSRVTNLKAYDSTLTVDKMASLLKGSFAEVYQGDVQYIELTSKQIEKIEQIKTEVFASDGFRFGTNPTFTNSVSQRFSWGEVEVCFTCKKDKIEEVKLFSDALDTDVISQAEEFLLGKEVQSLKQNNHNQMIDEIISLLQN